MPVKPVTPRITILALSTSQDTCIHIIGLHLGLGGITTPEDPALVKPWPIDRKVNFLRLPLPPASKGGVPMEYIHFGCVRVGHMYMENQNLAQMVTRFRQVLPKGEFRSV